MFTLFTNRDLPDIALECLSSVVVLASAQSTPSWLSPARVTICPSPATCVYYLLSGCLHDEHADWHMFPGTNDAGSNGPLDSRLGRFVMWSSGECPWEQWYSCMSDALLLPQTNGRGALLDTLWGSITNGILALLSQIRYW